MFKFLDVFNLDRKIAAAETSLDICEGLNPPEPTEENTARVMYTTILKVESHSNAHSLDICTVYDFKIVAKRGLYSAGNKIIYAPIDSILPKNIEDTLFPEGSKITLHKSRVRQIKIRGAVSQGLLINSQNVAHIVNMEYIPLETNVASLLSITKYEPPFVGASFTVGKDKQRNKKYAHPLFHQYNGIENVKWFPDFFKDGEQVVMQEKCHGTNSRASVLPYRADTLLKKLKKWLKLSPATEQCYGSNKVDISSSSDYNGFYGTDIYGDCFKRIDVFSKIRLGEIVYGEIIGPGIQKKYGYGLKEHRFILFDVKVLQEGDKFKWLNPDEVEAYASERGFEYVPVAYKGPYNKEIAYSLTKGPSLYNPLQKVREGIVIKAASDYDRDGNKRALKWINEDYLDDKSNSDNH